MQRLSLVVILAGLSCSEVEPIINTQSFTGFMKCTTTFGSPKIEVTIHPKSCDIFVTRDGNVKMNCTKIEYRNEERVTIDTRDPRGWWCKEI